jgi:hypothetical protein
MDMRSFTGTRARNLHGKKDFVAAAKICLRQQKSVCGS